MTLSAMTEMLQAMRTVLEKYGPTLADVSDEDLDHFWQIVGAFSMDLRDERARRHRTRAAMRS